MTAPADQKMPDITYRLDPETGEITRTDKDSTLEVAFYEKDTKTVEFMGPAVMKFRSPTIRFLNDSGVEINTLAVKGEKRDEPKEDEPPCPKMTIEAGDKTPAVVEWFKKYRPAEYAIRYGVRGPGEITKKVGYDTDERTGVKTPRYETVPAIIAERKTHLTEKPEANDQASAE